MVLAKVGECDYRVRVNGKEKVNHAKLLKQYVESEVVDTSLHEKILQQWVPGLLSRIRRVQNSMQERFHVVV